MSTAESTPTGAPVEQPGAAQQATGGVFLFTGSPVRGWQHLRERLIHVLLAGCALFSIAITLSIVGVLAAETLNFFNSADVTVREFLTSGRWSPLLGAKKHYGIWPLVCGTLLVTAVAAVVALPMGLATAVYLSEYARPRVRAIVKPLLEILAGIPTVVYGFFALTVITPALRALHGGFEVYNAASAGIAVGIMCLPIVTSLSEDALRAVPRSLREGAYAVGATSFHVSAQVVVPAAFSGVMAAFLLAVARAIGETMIVALAAGGLAHLTADPRQPAQTMTAYMVQVFLGDVSNMGTEYKSAYAVAAALFAMTLILTIISHRVTVRFREAYH
jgi:phosphate transport system permease protein